MGFSNTSNLARVRHYEEAHRYFTQTAKPRGSKWDDYERPLGTNAQWHYRIEQPYDGDWYDVILYRTIMARFYAPNAAGETRICYNGDGRNTSTSFMWDVLHVGKHPRLTDTEGVLRCVPIGSQRGFSTDLWFDVEGRLMVKASTHAPIASVHASKNLAEWKKNLKAKLDPVICLMEIAVQDMLAAVEGSDVYEAGQAFTSIPTTSDIDNKMKRWVGADCPDLNSEGYEAMRELYKTCAQYIIDRRIYKAEPKSQWSQGKTVPYTPPKPSAVTTSVINYLAKYAPYSVTKKDYRPLPQFPTEMPKNWAFV